jgi:hypothetical protein
MLNLLLVFFDTILMPHLLLVCYKRGNDAVDQDLLLMYR